MLATPGLVFGLVIVTEIIWMLGITPKSSDWLKAASACNHWAVSSALALNFRWSCLNLSSSWDAAMYRQHLLFLIHRFPLCVCTQGSEVDFSVFLNHSPPYFVRALCMFMYTVVGRCSLLCAHRCQERISGVLLSIFYFILCDRVPHWTVSLIFPDRLPVIKP